MYTTPIMTELLAFGLNNKCINLFIYKGVFRIRIINKLIIINKYLTRLQFSSFVWRQRQCVNKTMRSSLFVWEQKMKFMLRITPDTLCCFYLFNCLELKVEWLLQSVRRVASWLAGLFLSILRRALQNKQTTNAECSLPFQTTTIPEIKTCSNF